MVARWIERDSEEAWQWAKSIANHSSRAFIAGIILDHLGTHAPDQIIPKYRDLRESDPDFEMTLGESLMQAIAKRGTAEFLELLRLTPVGTRKTWSGQLIGDYPDDFDFGKITDELRKIAKENDGLVPVGFPGDFLRCWADRGFNEALQYVLDHGLKDIPNASWSGLLIAHEHEHGRRLTDEWYRGLIQGDSGFRVLEGILARSEIGFERNRFRELYPNPQDRDGMILRYFSEAEYTFRVEDHWDGLTLLSSPAKRMEALKSLKKTAPDEGANVTKDMAGLLELDLQTLRSALNGEVKQEGAK